MRGRFVDLVLEVAQSSEARSGDVLFTLGEKNTDEGLFILEGAVKVTRANGEVRYLEAPEFVRYVKASGWSDETALVEMAAAWRAWGAHPGAYWATFWCNAIAQNPAV